MEQIQEIKEIHTHTIKGYELWILSSLHFRVKHNSEVLYTDHRERLTLRAAKKAGKSYIKNLIKREAIKLEKVDL